MSKTVEVKMLVPYGIIVATIIAGAAFMSGWHMSQRQQEQVQARAAEMVSTLSKPAQQK